MLIWFSLSVLSFKTVLGEWGGHWERRKLFHV